jgi:transposase InsO family protein
LVAREHPRLVERLRRERARRADAQGEEEIAPFLLPLHVSLPIQSPVVQIPGAVELCGYKLSRLMVRPSKLRDEFLNGEMFYSLKEAQILTERWRVHDNTVRRHSSLGYRPPAPMAYSLAMPQPSESRSPASTVM